MAWFFEFKESTTLKEIRDFFADGNNCEVFIKNHRTRENAGKFDTVAAFLLGGVSNSNYLESAFSSGDITINKGTWRSNLRRWTVGDGESETPAINFCSEFKEEDTVETVYDKVNNWPGFINNEKKNDVLSLLNGSDNGNNNTSKNMGKNIKDIISNAIERNKQVIFTGAPGTGKTWSVREYVKEQCTDKNQYKFVQFHPSYDYADFVEGLRPVVIKGKENPTFVRMDGVFKEFCRHIVEENVASKNYYFIVDEINRADLAKVFGELMFGLEESYRGKDNLIQTQYKNLVTYRIIGKEDVDGIKIKNEDIGKAIPIERDVFKDGFYIPENLYFIGTMNDIDRSVDSMDFALRRRFQWIDVCANEIMKSSLHSILDQGNQDVGKSDRIDKLADKIIAMNEILSGNKYRFGLSEAYHIGPAYFKKIIINSDEELKTSLQSTFDTNITSILKEYTRGRKREDIIPWIEECRRALTGEN